ncbi:MAG: prepilin-type N-terminal cleavage/methylation domain-containing protein [Cyanobacteria bacterium HKST-UBA04]|nr:prepilin-type N-terminal cleavage/methylation domain-containing protein [Cyanobacteria bacterium HKST-UBA04]
MTPQTHPLPKHRQSGFTLPEVILALLLVGVLAALTIVSWVTKSGDKHALERAKLAAEEMVAAKKRWRDDNPAGNPTSVNVADNTKYLTKVSCDGATIKAADSEVTCGTCFCYRYADGGLLEVESPGTAVGSPAYVEFNYDPDGAKDTNRFDAVAMRLYIDSGRVTTYGADTATASRDPDWATNLWTEQ